MSNKWSFKFHLHFIYAAHMQSLIFTWKWFSVILQKNYVQLREKWNLIKLTVSVAAVQTYFQKR